MSPAIISTYITEMKHFGAPLMIELLELLKTDMQQNITLADFPQLPPELQSMLKELAYDAFEKTIKFDGTGSFNAIVTFLELNKTEQYEFLDQLISIGEAFLNNNNAEPLPLNLNISNNHSSNQLDLILDLLNIPNMQFFESLLNGLTLSRILQPPLSLENLLALT